MSGQIVVMPEAEAEYEEAVEFYETCRTGLGDEFAAEVAATYRRIARHPRAHAVARGNVRKAVVRVYPFCVYYRELPGGDVEVVSVFHTRRDPADWQRRV